MGERFTLEIFADTAQASAELKRFAAEQEATAKKLRSKANQPGTSGYTAPRPTLSAQAQRLGSTSAQIRRQQESGQTSASTAAKQQAEVSRQRAALSRTAQQTLGISATEADKFIASQERQGRIALVRALREETAATQGSVRRRAVDAAAQAANTEATRLETNAKRKSAVAKAAAKATEAARVRAGRDSLLAGSPEFIAAEKEAAEAKAARRRALQAATAETRRREQAARAVAAREDKIDRDRRLATDPANLLGAQESVEAAAARKRAERQATEDARQRASVEAEVARKRERALRDEDLATSPEFSSAQVAAAEAAEAKKAAARADTAATRQRAAVAAATARKQEQALRDQALAADPGNREAQVAAAQAAAARKAADREATRATRERAAADAEVSKAAERQRVRAERDSRLATDPTFLSGEQDAAAAAAERKRAAREATEATRRQAQADAEVARRRDKADRDARLATDPANLLAQQQAAEAAAQRQRAEREATADTRERAAAARAARDAEERNRVKADRDRQLASDPAFLESERQKAAAEAERKRAAAEATRTQREQADSERQQRAAVSRRRVAADRDAGLATDPANLAAERAAAEARAARRQAASEATAGVRVDAATQRRVDALNERAAVDTRLTDTAAGREAIHNAELAKARKRRIEAEERAAIKTAASGASGPPTRTQRILAATRGGDPADQQRLGQLLGGKAITTLGYAAASVAIFGIVGGLTSAVKEAEELERVFNNIEFQLTSFGQEDRIGEVSKSIRDLARDTGLGAAEIASVVFQFQGAFSGDTTRALEETAAAAELVKITGLSLTETVDAFTALTQNFDEADVSVRNVGDTALGLQERFGVLADQTISFAADLAPVAEAAGFTVQELEALGASAQKFSGRSGSSLAEAFGRIIPQVQGNASELINLFQEIPSLANNVPALSEAFAGGDIQKVFEILIANYGQLTDVQQNNVVSLIGGRREAAALVGVLENGTGILEEWGGQFNDSGKQAERFATLQQTLTQRLSEVSEQLKLLGVAIFESGFEDFLKSILSLAGQVASVLTDIGSGFAGLNNSLGGLPGKILAALAAMKALQALSASNTATKLAGFLPSVSGGIGGVGRGLLVNPALPLTSPTLTQSISSRGFTGTGRVVAANVADGIKSGYQSNKSVVNAAAAFVAFQLIESFTSNLAAEAQQAGIDRFQGERNTLERNQELSPEQLQRLRDQALQDSGLDRADNAAVVPVVGPLITDLSNRLSGALGLGNPEEEQAAIDEARSILNQQVADDVVAKIKAIREAGLLGNTDELGNLIANNVAITADGEQVAPEEVLRIAEKAAAGGTLTTGEQQIFFQAQTTFADFYRNNAEFQSRVAGTVDDINLQEATKTLAQARAQFEGGDLTKAEFATALAGAAAGAQAQIDAGIDDAARLAEEYTKVNEFRDFISQGIIDQLDLMSEIRTLRTGSEHPVQEASALLQAIVGGQLNAEDLRASITQYLDLQRAIVEKQADAADTVAEADAIRERGRDVSKSVRVALVSQQLDADVGFADLSKGTALEEYFGSLEEYNQETARLIVEQGLTAKEARLAVIDALIADTEVLLRAATRSRDRGDEDFLRGRLADLGRLRDRVSGSFDTPVADVDNVKGDLNSKNSEADDKAKALQDARFALLEAQAGDDPVAVARIGVQRAQAALAAADGDETEMLKARADLINAQRTLRDAELSLVESRFDLSAAYAADDPVAVANIAIQKAQFQLSTATNEGERISAQIALISAQRQRRDAINDIFDSQFDLVDALVANDPVQAAQAGLARANAGIARARNAAERNRALAAKVNAERAFKDAINDVLNSQLELAIAIADVGGDTVQSARLALRLAVQKLKQLKDSGAGAAALNRAQADVISASGTVRDSILADRQGYYQFLFDMGQITQGQLIEYLQSLLAIPGLTKQQVQDIQLQIKQLRDELGQDFQFNLPANLALPTLYQVQRVDQTGNRAGVTDNRQVTVNVNVSSNVELAKLEEVLANSVGTRVSGITPRRY